MTARVQENRTATPNTPPPNNSLQVGEIYLELASPQRIWAGVPTTVTASGVQLLLDVAAQATANAAAVQKAGDTMTGPLVLSGQPTQPAQAANKAYVDGLLVSPVFTGDPKAPTPPPGDADQSIATTAFVATSFAPIASPTFTGAPKAPTPSIGDQSTALATTAFVANTIAAGPPAGAVIAPTPPVETPGTLWWDSTGGQLYVRYDDGNSQQWVTAANMEGLANAATKADVAQAQNNVGRNVLHNPLFNVTQRGVGPFTTTATFTADRWVQYMPAGNTLSTVINGTNDAARAQVGDEACTQVLFMTFTGAAGAADLIVLEQNIEGVRRLGGKTVTVSFWAATSGGSLKLGVDIEQNFGTGGSPSALVLGVGQAVTVTPTYARYSLTFAVPSAAGKTLGTNGNDMTQLVFWLSSGSNSAVRSGGVGVQSGGIAIWGVQLEIAQAGQTQPTPLEKPDPQQDLAKCQRFYQDHVGLYVFGYNTAGAAIRTDFMLPVQMRTQPTVTILSPSYSNASAAVLFGSLVDHVIIGAAVTSLGSAAATVELTLSADL